MEQTLFTHWLELNGQEVKLTDEELSTVTFTEQYYKQLTINPTWEIEHPSKAIFIHGSRNPNNDQCTYCVEFFDAKLKQLERYGIRNYRSAVELAQHYSIPLYCSDGIFSDELINRHLTVTLRDGSRKVGFGHGSSAGVLVETSFFPWASIEFVSIDSEFRSLSSI